ncbi:unnamed protein product, partial [Rotaria sp. Silwood1]
YRSETIATDSLILPAIVHLMIRLRDRKEHVAFCTKLVQQLKSSIEKRFSGIINRINQSDIEGNDLFNDPAYFIATVLDSSFNFFWLHDLKLSANVTSRLKQNVIQLILDEMNEYLKVPSMKLFDKKTCSTPKPKQKKMFVYDDVYSDYSNDVIVMNPVAELEAYLNDPIRSNFSEY